VFTADGPFPRRQADSTETTRLPEAIGVHSHAAAAEPCGNYGSHVAGAAADSHRQSRRLSNVAQIDGLPE
jgi:hypothetical protein